MNTEESKDKTTNIYYNAECLKNVLDNCQSNVRISSNLINKTRH